MGDDWFETVEEAGIGSHYWEKQHDEKITNLSSHWYTLIANADVVAEQIIHDLA